MKYENIEYIQIKYVLNTLIWHPFRGIECE